MKSLTVTLFLIGTMFAKEVKVMFANNLSSETSYIQNYSLWYMGSDENKTTLSEMYSDNWVLIDVVKLNAIASSKQFWLFLER